MAERFTDGGVRFDTEVGSPMDERSAVNLDARLREVTTSAVAQAASAADRAAASASESLAEVTKRGAAITALVDGVDVRLDALEARDGVTAHSPVDGQTALLVSGPDTLTRKAVVQTVEATQAPALSLMDARVTEAITSSVSTHARPSAGGDGPRVKREVELFQDTAGRTGDGAKFFTAVQMGGKWHGYVSGHNSKEIWHLTSDDLLSGWTWDQPVISCASGSAGMVQTQAEDHVASPHAVIGPNGVLYLTYHGPLAGSPLQQPTFKAWSSNGVAFRSMGIVLPADYDNEGSPYRTSTSYATSARHGGMWHTIWQGTTGRNADAGDGPYAPMPVGYATSLDGAAYTKHPPIIPAPPFDPGLLAPGLVRLTDGWMVVGSYRAAKGSVQSVGVFMGETLESLHRVRDMVLPGAGRPQWINSPSFFFRDGRMWMVGGCARAGGGVGISAFELDWSAA